jgi:hypothetical protein
MKDDDGYIFVDRDGAYFAPLLSYLRTGELEVSKMYTLFVVQLVFRIVLSGNNADSTKHVQTSRRTRGIVFPY